MIRILSIILILYSNICFAQETWTISKPMNEIPDTTIKGSLLGKEFTLGEASYNGAAIFLRSATKSRNWPIREIMIFVDLSGDQRSWLITPDSDPLVPSIHMRYKKEGSNHLRSMMFTVEYSMNLIITEITETEVRGKIHLSLPDYENSYLVGSFAGKRG